MGSYLIKLMHKIYVDIDLTICFYDDWKGDYNEAEPNYENITKINNGTVAETTAATANITLPSLYVVPRNAAISGTIVRFCSDKSIEVTAKSL